MRWFLRVQTGREFRDIAVLSAGQEVVVGRTPTADLTFPDDDLMSGRHIRFFADGNSLQFEDLKSTNGSFQNGEPATRGAIKPGDTFLCGNTTLSFEIDGNADPAAPLVAGTIVRKDVPSEPKHQHGAKPAASEEIPADCLRSEGFVAPGAAEVIAQFQLGKVVTLRPAEMETCDAFAKRCLKEGADNDAIEFLARALPKRLGVWWAVCCIEAANAEKDAKDAELIAHVTDWVTAPSESLRRRIMELAQATEMNTAAAWAGVTVFWSHGSMAPPNAPAVPPGPELPGKALSGSVILASVVKSPEKAPSRRASFVEMAQSIASGKRLWS